MQMQFGILTGNFGTFGEDPGVDGCLAMAEEAERLGYDSVWVHDHIVMPAHVSSRYLYNATGESQFRVDQYIYDPIATMAAIAARTQRIRIGTSVLVVPYRNPLHLAKELATVDRISHGRIILGIGVGWMQEEFDALGIGELYANRGSVTDEWMAVCIDLWTQQGASSFNGRWVKYHDVGANPLPVQKPYIPIWIGGKTPAAFRRVARYGNGYQSIGSTPEEVAGELANIRSAMEQAGRDPAELTISMLAAGGIAPGAGKDEIVDTLGRHAEAGLQHLVGIPWMLGQERLADASSHARLEATIENANVFASEVLPAFR